MIRIEQYDGLNRTPALTLALKAQLELLETGRMEAVLNVFWDQQAIVAFYHGRPVGVITWKHAEWAKQIDIALGYVEPAYRGKGIYQAMWEVLVYKAQTLKVPQIASGTHVENATMRMVAIKQGRTELGIILRYDVPPMALP